MAVRQMAERAASIAALSGAPFMRASSWVARVPVVVGGVERGLLQAVQAVEDVRRAVDGIGSVER